MSEIAFWFFLAIILYTYGGYLILLLIIWAFKSIFKEKKAVSENYEPSVTIFIAAYNEKDIIPSKVENLRQLDYPKQKLFFLWVTDGSDDGSEKLLSQYPDMKVIHSTERKGKVGAINRGMQYVDSDIVIFCDANSMLSPTTVREVVKLFSYSHVGCVAGEKHILLPEQESAQGAGEGVYWRVESFIKWLESEVNSTVGAAGEICAIRSCLFEPLEPDTILDDFVLSMRMIEKGYRIKYAHKAVATELASFSIADELKRKVRIAAGCIQAIPRLKSLLNIWRYGFFAIQFWSHKILRWVAVPPSIIAVFFTNILIFNHHIFYRWFLYIQILFYLWVGLGFVLRRHKIRYKFIFFPYYLMMMNYALVLGLIRYLRGRQSVNWEKAKRMSSQN
ncbi:MAG: glycosyltransferase [Bacteroidales bacterium]|nr:glycosyltransferase [Bacteroidales bacterium]